jgi:hypothetical protein
VLERPVAQLTCDSVTRDISNKRVCSPVLRATNVVYARVPGDQWAVTWTAYNRWVPELLIGKGETEVAPFAMAAELKAAVRADVHRVDPLMCAVVDSWDVGAWSTLFAGR